MKQIASEKYTIAWFKLAECVARGEREKAFGVYRLLAHSLPDQAYMYQLEGDLLHSFDDAAAWEKYYLAAATYAHEQRWYEAAGIYEHLKFLNKLPVEHLYSMMMVHDALGNEEYVKDICSQLVTAALHEKKYKIIEELLATMPTQLSPDFYIKLYGISLLNIIKAQQMSSDKISQLLKTYVSTTISTTNALALTSFLTELESIDAHLYKFCKNELKS